MSDSGWIKLYRKSNDWRWRHCPKHWSVWTWILTNASYNHFEHENISIAPGQVPIGLHALSKEIRVSTQSIRTVLTHLASANEITIKSSTKGTIITVINWERYQSTNNQINKRSTNDQQTINKRSTTTKELKELKELKNKNTMSGKPDDSPPFEKIINYLNAKLNTQYRYSTKKTQSLIKARFNENFKYEDFTKVIDSKYTEWHKSEDFAKFLRPETLFGNKFESYLNGVSAKAEKIDWDYIHGRKGRNE